VKKLEGRMDTCMDTWLKDFTKEACKSLKNMVPSAGIESRTLSGFRKPIVMALKLKDGTPCRN
jgi:hypothetical protein